MDINHVKTVLLEAARDNGDLVGEPKLSKKALKAARAIETAKKAGNQTAHPAPKPPNAPPAAAQGAGLKDKDKDKASKEICIQNLYGSCKLGDACPRKHVELSKLNEEAAKRGKQRKEKKDKEGDKAPDKTSRAPNPEREKKGRVCFQWQANGPCELGEKCIFNHPTAGQKAKACRIKRPKTPIDLEAGTLVMVPHDRVMSHYVEC